MAYSNRSDWNRDRNERGRSQSDRDYERQFSRDQQEWDDDSRGSRENMERDYYGSESRGGYGGSEGQGSRMQRGYGQGDYDQRFGDAGTQYGGGQGARFSESGYGRGREYLGREGRDHYGNEEGGWQGREREQWRNRGAHGEYDRDANYGGYSSSGTGNYSGYGGSGGSYRGGYGRFDRGESGGNRRYGREEGGRGMHDMDQGYSNYGQGLDWRERGYGGRGGERRYGQDIDWREGGYGGRSSEGRYGQGGFGQSSGRPSGGQAYGNYGGAGMGYESGSQGGRSQFGSQGPGQGQETGQHRGRGPRGYRRSDERIREEVCDCLADDDRLDASNIDVTVKDCEVQLSGTVSSRDDKRWAEMLVERISGVKEVQNSLRVQEQQRIPTSTASQAGQSAATGTQTTGSSAATTGKGRDMQH